MGPKLEQDAASAASAMVAFLDDEISKLTRVVVGTLHEMQSSGHGCSQDVCDARSRLQYLRSVRGDLLARLRGGSLSADALHEVMRKAVEAMDQHKRARNS